MSFLPPADRAAVRLPLLGAALALAGAVHAQHRVPLTAPADDPQEPSVRETVAGGEVRFVPIPELDDGIPMPGARYVEEGPNAREVVPADADPFFLGFAAGNHHPPADERVDPLLRKSAQALPADREGGVTFGFAMFSKRITRERIELIESMGATYLGRHPHYAAKLAVPPHAIDAIADLDFVRWIGVPRDWQKLHPLLTQEVQQAEAGEELDVWINLYTSDLNEASTFEYVGEGSLVEPEIGVVHHLTADEGSRRWQSNGWQQEALEAEGVQIRQYVDSIQAFRATLTPAELAVVRDLDFVQFVELELEPTLAHEESQPMCGVDITRPSNSGGTFGDAVVGEADTGYEHPHFMLNHVFGWGWDLSGSGTGPWNDGHGHGSHVGGSILGGSWSGHEALYGAAPGLGSAADLRFYNVKIFDDSGSWGGAALQDILDRFHTDVDDGNGNVTPYPHVVSHSWGTTGAPFVGSEADCRTLDNEIYTYRNLQVFAAGNEGPGSSTLRLQPTSKNVFTIGNVYPYRSSSIVPDDLRGSSSRGPCGDGRWKPNIVAPGTSIDSADAHDQDDVTSKTGTSMSTPHVSGIAAQLVDRYDFLQYNPTTLAAALMATSLTKTNHTFPSDDHLDDYGAGRVSAYRAIGGNSFQAYYFWGYVQSDTSHAELDFTVSPGATRLTVVMTYHELAASSGASQALVQDIDTYIDREPFSGSGNSGDYSFQISHIDNTEIRTLTNPGDGAWKVKTWPTNVSSWFAPYVGVSVVVEYGDITPEGTLTMSSNKAYAQPGETVQVTGSVKNESNGSTAMSIYLDGSTGGMALDSVRSHLADGSVSELIDNVHSGTEVQLGDMRHSQTRSVVWEGDWSTEGTKTFSASVISPNANVASDSVQVIVDGTNPGVPPNLHSTDHTANEHSCDLTVSMDWDPASDSLSGIDGYSVEWSHSSTTVPDTTVDTSATSTVSLLPPSSQGWWYHVRAIDNAGNAGGTAHAGPYFLGEAQVTNYCASNANSTGQMALLDTMGPVCLADEQFTLRTVNLPQDEFGYYFFSQTKTNVPGFGGSQGVLCVGGSIIRFAKNVLNSGSAGEMIFTPDLDNLPGGAVFTHGSTWNFQLWFRDKNPIQTSNTSNGLEVIWD